MIKIGKKNLFVIICYLLITLFLSWPLILHLDDFLLSKNYRDISHSDTLVHLGYITQTRNLISEGKNMIIVDYADVAQTYIFSGILLTYIFQINDIIFHNLYFLLCIFLSGLFMYFFMFELTKDKVASFFSGFLYMSSNYLFIEYFWGHTHVMQIQWIPLIFLFLEKILKCQKSPFAIFLLQFRVRRRFLSMLKNTPRTSVRRFLTYKKIKYAIFLGISLSLQILSSSQYTTYLSFIIPLYLLLRIYFVDKKLFVNKFFWLNIFISVLVAFVLSSFYLIKRINISSVIRTIEENLVYNWTMHSLKQLFDMNINIYLGIVQFLLILLGIYIILLNFKYKQYRKYISFEILLLFLIVCMFGPVSYFMPYYWLYKIWPFIKYFRVPLRLFPFVLMCSSILASLFLLYLKKINRLKLRIPILIFIIVLIIICQLLPRISHYYIFYL